MNKHRSMSDQPPMLDEVMSVWAKDRKFRSRLQIAEALGRTKSPALIAVIGVLVGVGYLTIREIDLPNHITMYEYSPAPKWEEEMRWGF